MKSLPRNSVSCLTVFSLLASNIADADGIDEITVTATRRDVSIDSVAAAITLIRRDNIVTKKLATDALANQPGVFLQQTTSGQGAAIIRGLKGSSILHIVDGVRLNNAIFRSAPTPYAAYIPTTAVEQVEIIRGSAASLYGSEAVGGVVHFVTRRPVFDSEQVGIKSDWMLTLDSAEDTRSLRAIVDIGTRRLATTFSVEHLRTGERRVGSGTGPNRLPTSYESSAARFAVSGTPDNNDRWLLDLQFLTQPSTPRVDELVAGFGQTAPSSSEFLFAPSQRQFAHLQYTTPRLFDSAEWRADLAWQRVVDDRRSIDNGATQRDIEKNQSDLFGFSSTLSNDSGLFSWVAGIDVYSDRVTSERYTEDVVVGALTEVSPRFPSDSSIEQIAVFANAERSLGERLMLGTGIRISDVSISVPQSATIDAANINVSKPSGDLSLRYELDDEWTITGNLSFGFRAPNIFDLGTLGSRPGNRFNQPNTDLSAETVRQVDLGVRRNGPLSRMQLALYSLDYRDRIASVSTGEITPLGRAIVESQNTLRSKIHGAEFIWRYQLTPVLETQLTANLTRGEQESSTFDTEPGDRIPPLAALLTLSYQYDDNLTVATNIAYNATQDRLSARDQEDSRIDPQGTARWLTVGFSADYQSPRRWSLLLELDNLFDKRFRVHGSGIDAPGRNLALHFRYRHD